MHQMFNETFSFFLSEAKFIIVNISTMQRIFFREKPMSDQNSSGDSLNKSQKGSTSQGTIKQGYPTISGPPFCAEPEEISENQNENTYTTKMKIKE
ncbi:8522_t:CDS:2 [Paraglomus brasilianum]|uniref:8522_t:CDS:1 n=1 Tax=Paraglomus brasilianum TaxID=144538 RepID=A0A9N8WFA9_9GLOM|nr:8522_t:CDS:2 [Paraglomus brasilianum]